MTKTHSLEERVRKLEDTEAIRRLTAVYAGYVDNGWNGKTVELDALKSVFAPDARWRCAAMGVDVFGVDAVITMLRDATAAGDFAMHSFSNPVITVDGDHAGGHWLLWVAVKAGDAANQVFQSEDLTYVRTAEGWRIRTLDLNFGMMLV